MRSFREFLIVETTREKAKGNTRKVMPNKTRLKNQEELENQEELDKALLYSITDNDSHNLVQCISDGADLNKRDKNGNTPLHHASSFEERANCVRILLKHGANPNAKNDNGETPLHIAVAWNNTVPSIKTLIENGADPLAKDAKGMTPLDVARSDRIRRILRDAIRVRMSATDLPDETFVPAFFGEKFFVEGSGPSGWARQRVEKTIEDAVSEHRPRLVVLDYVGESGERELKTVEPYSHRKKGGKKYLYAWDLETGGIRSFRCSRIYAARKTDREFTPRFEIELGDGHVGSPHGEFLPKRDVRVAKKMKHAHLPPGFARRKAVEMVRSEPA